MEKPRLFAALMLSLGMACNAIALDLVLNDGSTVKDIRLRSMEPQGIIVRTGDAVQFIDYLQMSEADRLTFGFDSKKYDGASAKTEEPAQGTPPTAQAPRSAAPSPAVGATSTSKYSSGSTAPKASSSSQCAATTKKGGRCSRSAAPGSSYCWQHKS